MKHSKTPWEIDHRECEGVRYFVVTDVNGKVIFDTCNSEVAEIHEDFDEDGFRNQWDAKGEVDLKKAMVCANILAEYENPELLPELLKAVKEMIDFNPVSATRRRLIEALERFRGSSTQIKVGDVVESVFPFVLASGCFCYNEAVCVDVHPLTLVSLGGDMLWKATLYDGCVRFSRKATADEMAIGVNRFQHNR